MIIMRNDLIEKVINSDAADLNGVTAGVKFLDPMDLGMTVRRTATLSVEGQTLTATYLDGSTKELISPLYNNYYAHDLHSVIV